MNKEQRAYKHIDRHIAILNVLEQYKKSNPTRMFTTAEIAKEVKKGISIIVRDVKVLSDLGCLKKTLNPVGGHSYTYSFLSIYPTKLKTKKHKEEITHVEFTPESFNELLQLLSREPWRPKIFNTARNFSQGIAELYKLGIDARYGAAIEQADINVIRQGISMFRQDLIKVLSVVDGILIKPELWNKVTLPLFLLPDTDEELVKQHIDDIIHNN